MTGGVPAGQTHGYPAAISTRLLALPATRGRRRGAAADPLPASLHTACCDVEVMVKHGMGGRDSSMCLHHTPRQPHLAAGQAQPAGGHRSTLSCRSSSLQQQQMESTACVGDTRDGVHIARAPPAPAAAAAPVGSAAHREAAAPLPVLPLLTNVFVAQLSTTRVQAAGLGEVVGQVVWLEARGPRVLGAGALQVGKHRQHSMPMAIGQASESSPRHAGWQRTKERPP